MKRRKLLEHLKAHNCEVEGEGKKHTRVRHRVSGAKSFDPRHREVKTDLAREICKQLGIPAPPGG
jgi:hypothetical protein